MKMPTETVASPFSTARSVRSAIPSRWARALCDSFRATLDRRTAEPSCVSSFSTGAGRVLSRREGLFIAAL